MHDIHSKILTLTQAVEWRQALRRHGNPLIVTNGCFDVLTPGHVAFLTTARNLEHDAGLLVLLNSDDSIRTLKGSSRPIWNQEERALVLAALVAVHIVVVFPSVRCTDELIRLAPDIYAKGADYTISSLNSEEREALQRIGTQIRILPYDPRYSSTKLIAKIHND